MPKLIGMDGHTLTRWAFDNDVIDALQAGCKTAREIANHAHYSIPGTHGAMRRLLAKGLIEKIPGTGTAGNGQGRTPWEWRIVEKYIDI